MHGHIRQLLLTKGIFGFLAVTVLIAETGGCNNSELELPDKGCEYFYAKRNFYCNTEAPCAWGQRSQALGSDCADDQAPTICLGWGEFTGPNPYDGFYCVDTNLLEESAAACRYTGPEVGDTGDLTEAICRTEVPNRRRSTAVALCGVKTWDQGAVFEYEWDWTVSQERR